MAGITSDKAGLRRLRFIDSDGIRRTIYLGRMPAKQAETVRVHVEKLTIATISRCSVEAETARWVSSLDDVLRGKLSQVGLIQARENATLAGFVESYIGGRLDAKPNTLRNWRQVQRHLLTCFDGSRSLRSITKADGKQFRQHLVAGGYADNSIRKWCSVARQFFTDALERELIEANPFKQRDIPTSTGGNPDRQAYITDETAQAVLGACPDAEWRLLFALSRYAGLRCPSEHLALRWSDVNWERSRMTVRSPKTERHKGGAQRVIPIFPQLRPHLEAAFELVKPGAEYIISRYREPNANLRTQLLRIIGRAGVKPWPRLFNNLRASCETDLMRIHPAKAVTDWIGHSLRVAIEHYVQTTDADFDKASSPQSSPDSDRQPVSPLASSRNPLGNSHISRVSRRHQVSPTGVEPEATTTLPDNDLEQLENLIGPRSSPSDPETMSGIDWGALPDSVRAAVAELLRSATEGATVAE